MKNHSFIKRIHALLAVAAVSVSALIISSCGNSGGDSAPPTYSVGGSVTGATGSGLVLQLNGGDDLAVVDGNFTFTTALNNGSSYAVTALSYPSGQTCQVTNGSGNITANVNNVSVECRTNADPSGYYTNTGSATVGDTQTTEPLDITDFQAIVQDNRFMAMSVANRLVYDGPLEMFGDTFTATVSVYRDGEMIYAGVNVSGTFTPSSTTVPTTTLSGTLAGTEEGAGTFELVYATTDLDDAAMARIVNTDPNLGVGHMQWSAPLGSSITSALNNAQFNINGYSGNYGSVYGSEGQKDGNFIGCTIYTISNAIPAFVPIPSTRMYGVTVQVRDCYPDIAKRTTGTDAIPGAGYYTGFATSRSDPDTDDTLVFIVTSANGQYTASGDFK